MTRVSTFLVVLLCAVLLWVGNALDYARDLYQLRDGYISRYEETIEGITSELITPAPYINNRHVVSEFQGVDVELAGLRYFSHDWWFDEKSARSDLKPFLGYAFMKPEQFHIDLDHDESGLPDILVNIAQPQVLTFKRYSELKTGKVSEHLRRKLSIERPVETFEWSLKDQNGETIKAKMEMWLLTFDLVIQTVPSPTHNNKQKEIFHKIYGDRLSDDEEYKNQRHKPFDVLLKLYSKPDNYYVGIPAGPSDFVRNETPFFGIGAIEILDTNYDGDPEETEQRIGAFLPAGQSLTLFKQITALPGAKVLSTEGGQKGALMRRVAQQTGNFYAIS